jgi:hypothetical protein
MDIDDQWSIGSIQCHRYRSHQYRGYMVIPSRWIHHPRRSLYGTNVAQHSGKHFSNGDQPGGSDQIRYHHYRIGTIHRSFAESNVHIADGRAIDVAEPDRDRNHQYGPQLEPIPSSRNNIEWCLHGSFCDRVRANRHGDGRQPSIHRHDRQRNAFLGTTAVDFGNADVQDADFWSIGHIYG